MKKLNKRDRILIKLYRIISFLNNFSKVVKKLVAEKLSQFCKAQGQFHKKQMREKKNQSAIDAAAIIIHKVHGI